MISNCSGARTPSRSTAFGMPARVPSAPSRCVPSGKPTPRRVNEIVSLRSPINTIELKVSHPLMPLGLFKLRNLSVANIAGVLWAAAMFAWFFLSALYLQLVLGYSPLEVGLAFLPGNLIMGVLSAVIRPPLRIRDRGQSWRA